MLGGLSLPNVKRLPRGKRCGEASLHQRKRQDLKQEVRAYGVLPLFPHAETGTDWYGGMGDGELFPLGVFYAAACRGLGKRIYALWGGRRGNLRSPPIAALKQFSLLPAWSGGYPTRKEGFLW